MADKFCYACGRKCIEFATGKFNTTDGTPVLEYRCPSGLCGHLGIVHAVPSVKAAGVCAWLNGKEICPACGKTTWVDP